MDSVQCHIIFVHQDVREARQIRFSARHADILNGVVREDESAELARVLLPLVEAFGLVYVCPNSSSCMSKVIHLQDSAVIDLRPTIVLIDTPFEEGRPESDLRSRSRSPHSLRDDTEIHTPEEDAYGLELLKRIISEAQLRSVSKLVVPVPVLSSRSGAGTDADSADPAGPLRLLAAHRRMIRKCLELGAVDVIVSPLSDKCITTIEICAYRAHKDAAREQQTLVELRRGRQRSWVGVNESKPYAYLREAMVSGLMKHICRSGDGDDRIANVRIAVSSERRAAIGRAVGQWSFSAHAFTDDELIVAAMVVFRHALDMPELENWRIPTDQLINFLVACRAAYNNFVPYHNFRHVVDVLQATFHFLVKIGTLAPYADHSEPERPPPEKSPVASLLRPFEALTLLITAIGHDVGHPGVNNGFLVTLNAPLAQLYNDRSVLESFHCAAFSQILRRYWTSAFEDVKMRSLMISSILATDMGLHFDYIKKMESTQRKLEADNSTDAWNGRLVEEQKKLACSLLIKCADISNVARKIDTALQWMHILADEFARQASMELELEIPSALMAEPKKDVMSLCKAQLGFMNIFAIPLFEGVADVMPAMRYTVRELETNRGIFEQRIREEQAKKDPLHKRFAHTPSLSPRTMSPAAETDKGAGESRQSVFFRAVSGTAPRSPVSPDKFEDPFHHGDKMEIDPQAPPPPSSAGGKQRISETTDGSNSGPYSGEWASQATSATTGKMPLSPSTQNTSLVSRDSFDQQLLAVPPPFAAQQDYDQQRAAMPGSRGNDGVPPLPPPPPTDEGPRLVKKKSSRFRINGFPFFKRNKGASPPLPAADATVG